MNANFSASVFASDAMGASLDPKDYQYPQPSAAHLPALAREAQLHGIPGHLTAPSGLGAGRGFAPYEANHSNKLNSQGGLRWRVRTNPSRSARQDRLRCRRLYQRSARVSAPADRPDAIIVLTRALSLSFHHNPYSQDQAPPTSGGSCPSPQPPQPPPPPPTRPPLRSTSPFPSCSR